LARGPQVLHPCSSSNVEAVALSRAPKNVGEYQDISLESTFTLGPVVSKEQSTQIKMFMPILPLSRTKEQSVTRNVHPLQIFRSAMRGASSFDCVEQPWQSTDPAYWFLISQVLVYYWMERGLEQCQNRSPSGNYPYGQDVIVSHLLISQKAITVI